MEIQELEWMDEVRGKPTMIRLWQIHDASWQIYTQTAQDRWKGWWNNGSIHYQQGKYNAYFNERSDLMAEHAEVLIQMIQEYFK